MAKKKDALTLKVHGQIVDAFSPQATTLNGSDLIKEAINKVQVGYQDRVIGFITATMEQITMLQYNIEQAQKGIDFGRARLMAIEKGEFSINAAGQISFNDGGLNGT